MCVWQRMALQNPRPTRVIHDNGLEFATEFLELLASYDAKSVLITVENPRLNIVERMHKTLGDMIRIEKFEDNENPMRKVDILLSTCIWSLQSTTSVIMERSPRQLVFNYDMIM